MPAPDTTPDRVERAKPVVQVSQTAVPATLPDPTQSDVVAELPDTRTKSFKMIGVTWSAATTSRDFVVTVRTHVDGHWTTWQGIDFDDAQIGSGRPGTEPLWVGEADGVAVKVTSASGVKPADIRIVTIDPGTSDDDTMAVTPALYSASSQQDGAADVLQAADGAPTFTPKPSIITRSSWGASAGTPCDTPLVGSSTKGVVIHHTAGSNSYAAADSKSIVRGIQAYHVKGHGWCDIGYNVLVDKYGQTFEGRRGGIYQTVRAAHSGNAAVNTYTMGVSMMANLDKVKPSIAMKDAMVRVIGWRVGTTYMKAKGSYGLGGLTLNKIAGHRDVVSTGCPGRYGYQWLSENGGLRDRVAAYIANYTSPIKTLAGKLGTATTGPVFVGEAPAGEGRRTQFGKQNIFWSRATGVHAVWGSVLTEYKRLGLQGSSLGFPSGDYTVSADQKTGTQQFANGYIRYTASTKTAVAHTGSTTPAPSTAPVMPTGLAVVPTSSAATFSWSAAKNAKTYSICLLPNGTTSTCTKLVNGITTTSAAVSGLKPTGGTDWYVKVRSTNGTVSPWSSKVGFNLKPATSANALTVPGSRKIALTGHGFGHGIGMSQYGAQGAATAGKSYYDIVRYYYPGTALAKRSGNIRVLLSRDTTDSVIVIAQTGLKFRNLVNNATLSLPTTSGGGKINQWRIIQVSGKMAQSALQYKMAAWHTYKSTLWTGAGQFESATPMSLLLPNNSTMKYRGALRSAPPTKGSVDRNTVNVLSIDNYVRGVVSAEMPSSWKAEALKSQSVAARTYGVRSMLASRYYDICDTTACQVYGGVAKETTATDAAITATAGKILTYGGKAAFTQFSSSSGGWSAAGSFAYLKAKADSYDNWSGNSVHDWATSVSASTLEKNYPTIGSLKTLKITKRGGSGDWGGRVSSLTLAGSKGSKTITGNDARFVLGLRSNWFRFN